MQAVLYEHDLLGRIAVPKHARDLISLPGRPAKRRYAPGEIGVFVATQERPEYDDTGRIRRLQMLWASITHNERVDVGALYQAQQVFGGGNPVASPSATLIPVVIAIANGSITKTKTDQSLGSASAGVTTNEHTANGLQRVAGDARATADYTAPSTLGGQFTQRVKKTFTAGATMTAFGAGLFDSATPAGSRLYVEDVFGTNAALVANDLLTVNIDVLN